MALVNDYEKHSKALHILDNQVGYDVEVVQEAKQTLDNAIKELAELKRLVNLWGEDFRKQFNREEKI